jgi:hypothetical protein
LSFFRQCNFILPHPNYIINTFYPPRHITACMLNPSAIAALIFLFQTIAVCISKPIAACTQIPSRHALTSHRGMRDCNPIAAPTLIPASILSSIGDARPRSATISCRNTFSHCRRSAAAAGSPCLLIQLRHGAYVRGCSAGNVVPGALKYPFDASLLHGHSILWLHLRLRACQLPCATGRVRVLV